jgi:hypothetical protein
VDNLASDGPWIHLRDKPTVNMATVLDTGAQQAIGAGRVSTICTSNSPSIAK